MSELYDTLNELALSRNSVINSIIKETALAFGLTPDAVLRRDRSKSVSEARAMICFVARRCTRMSSTEVARALRLDHTSVLSAVKRVEALRLRDEWFASATKVLLERFGEIEESVQQ